jgi:hypothetical protein
VKLATLAAIAAMTPFAAASAAETPKLPAAAKKLNGAEIAILYRDATVVGMNFDNSQLLTFSAKINSAAASFVSHVVANGRYLGAFSLTFRIEADLWCYKPTGQGQEKCVSVFRDGDIIYEMNANGSVSARNMVIR